EESRDGRVVTTGDEVITTSGYINERTSVDADLEHHAVECALGDEVVLERQLPARSRHCDDRREQTSVTDIVRVWRECIIRRAERCRCRSYPRHFNARGGAGPSGR